MAKAYKCDICGKLTTSASKIKGIDFKIGERYDSINGMQSVYNEVEDVCYE